MAGESKTSISVSINDIEVWPFRVCLVPKIFLIIFRFPVTSIFGHMQEVLNVDKKI
jgi:hypothetical protein